MESGQVADVWDISASTINEAKYSFSYFPEIANDTFLGHNYPAAIGWKFAQANDLPGIYLSDYASLTPQSNSVYNQMVLDLSDVVTMVRGKHILHFGGDLIMYRDNATQWGNTNAGQFNFAGSYTGRWTNTNANRPPGTPAAETCASPDSTTGIGYADFLLWPLITTRIIFPSTAAV